MTKQANWKSHAETATVDITAARYASDSKQALEHLRDAETAIEKAIDALEDDLEEEGED